MNICTYDFLRGVIRTDDKKKLWKFGGEHSGKVSKMYSENKEQTDGGNE